MVVEQFKPEATEARVLHVDEWPRGPADVAGVRRRARLLRPPSWPRTTSGARMRRRWSRVRLTS